MRRAEPFAGLGGAALLVAAFAGGGFGFTDVLLALVGLLALAVPLVSLLTHGPAKSIRAAVLASGFGWIAVLIGLLRIGDEWLPLVAGLVAWVGAWLSMRDDSTPGAVPPDVPRRPAPKISVDAEP